MKRDFSTRAKNTWCPGCGNFAILNAFKSVLGRLADEGTPVEEIAMLSGIGCHAKISDYCAINSYYTIHGRAIPVAEGLKAARPRMKVVVFAGDGDTYGEGLEHLVFAAKRNADITVVIHDNRVYGLTTGQYTPTSPRGFRGRSTPAGTTERPFNPLALAHAAGATFIARGYSNRLEMLKRLLYEAIVHPGFALLDVLQVCATFFNMYERYNAAVYEISDHDPADASRALELMREWDYGEPARIPLGLFLRRIEPVYEPAPPPAGSADRTRTIADLLNESM